jgi:sulfur-oxidizing protein SoxB
MATTLTLFQLNDVYGYLNLHQEALPPTGLKYRRNGGYAHFATRRWSLQPMI